MSCFCYTLERYARLHASCAFGTLTVERIETAVAELRRAWHELSRPLSAPLRDGIYGLRLSSGRVQYWILFFFAGPGVAVLSHGCTKEQRVLKAEIERSLRRRPFCLTLPARHTA